MAVEVSVRHLVVNCSKQCSACEGALSKFQSYVEAVCNAAVYY